MTRTTGSVLSSLATLLSAAALLTPRPAEACGGTFCDSGPNAMPVDQTGEVILFVMGEGYTEAHIQIEYDPNTNADKFAWVVPLQALPEFSVGSQPLFGRVLQGTVPAYGFTTQFGPSCGDGDGSGGLGFVGGGSGGEDGAGDGGEPGPDVVLQEVVGAFEVTVLQGGTAQELVEWLNENDYQQDPEAEPIFEEYLAENYLFAAFKLVHDATTSEIHPVTLTFQVEEACVPIRLTRIAAKDDMQVRTFFLAEHRVVPQTYRHVLVNPLKLDWPNFAANYNEVITMAVDADMANGKAFVTEYAGPSDIVQRFGIYENTWNSGVFGGTTPIEAVALLVEQNLMFCYEDWGAESGGSFETDTDGGPPLVCDYNHPLLRGVVNKYIPVPEGVNEPEFYGCLSCYEEFIDLEAWDPAGFANDLETRIIEPGQHAIDILDAFPTLTRMFTTISPHEMTTDPFFHQNPDLQPVDLTNQLATQILSCEDNNQVWVLPDGREVFVPDGVWPSFDDEMPWEEEVAEIGNVGAPLPLSDRTAEINQALVEYNCQFGYPSPEVCGQLPDDSTADGGTDTCSGDMCGETGAGQDGNGLGDRGCGCQADGNEGSAAWLTIVLGLGLGALRRRRATASDKP